MGTDNNRKNVGLGNDMRTKTRLWMIDGFYYPDSVTNTMCEKATCYQYGDQHVVIAVDEVDSNAIEHFTNVVDNAGIEIWEGDKVLLMDKMQLPRGMNITDMVGVVKYMDGGFSLVFKNEEGNVARPLCMLYKSTLSVVGNIHQ